MQNVKKFANEAGSHRPAPAQEGRGFTENSEREASDRSSSID
ncbi:hypothetical protein LEP1GSC050_1952 [Leptospira broomii serovar Hurstbridge str. 5399]|uniref:Uncharacterized protein n=1 Tax=Leptospira broomii serovar Hurstbridge str. 5399 TaxID=1049789 RepID=T0F8L9_9LEPT|nr:hypothetical protein LEP1GSC050_1952 [Leptospira broomii serovar Hurstbridge str. 5399]